MDKSIDRRMERQKTLQREFETIFFHELPILRKIRAYAENPNDQSKKELRSLIRNKWELWQKNSSGSVGEVFTHLTGCGVFTQLPHIREGESLVPERLVPGKLLLSWQEYYTPMPGKDNSESKKTLGSVVAEVVLDMSLLQARITAIERRLELVKQKMDAHSAMSRMRELRSSRHASE